MARKAKTSTNVTSSTDELTTSSTSGEMTGIMALDADTSTSEYAPAGASGADADAETSLIIPAPQASVSKVGRIRAMLAAPAGATLPALCEATGWQSHSVRAALTGLRKAGSTIEKGTADDGATVYRIVANAEEDR